MFNNPDDIKIDDISLGTAVCKDEQEMEYHQTAVIFFLSCGLFIPICVIVLLVIIISSSYSELSSAIDKEENHANIAALVFTELLFSTFVVAVDIVALVLVVQGNLEFSSHSNFSLAFVIITTVLDAAAEITYGILLYLGLPEFIQILRSCKKTVPVCCKNKCLEHKKAGTTWIVVSMCSVPLFCLASHSGYIIAAWLSDTQHAGPATLFYIISFLYCFIIFRQLYKLCNRKLQEARHCKKACFNRFISLVHRWLKFLILLSLPLVAIEVFVIYSLAVLPATITAAPTVGSLTSFPGRTRSGNEANLFYLAFIIITGFFTYKFLYTEDEPKQFMKAFVDHLKEKDPDLTGQDAEAAGKAVGEVAYSIIEHYREEINNKMSRI